GRCPRPEEGLGPLTVEESFVDRFRSAFFGAVQTDELASILKKASATANLAAWTRALTDAVVEACDQVGLFATAKWRKLELLPIHRSEYLALDVVAFAEGERRWRFPSAIMELENSPRDCVFAMEGDLGPSRSSNRLLLSDEP